MTIPPKTHNEQHSKTYSSKTYSSKMHSSKPRNPKTSMRLALPTFLALRMLAVLLLGSLALALACAPADPNAGKIRVSTYYSNVGETTYLLPVVLGQAVADDSSTFVLANDDVILTLSNLANGDHLIHFGTVASGGANTHSENYIKTVAGGTITILKSELKKNSFSFADGAVIGISGPGITDTQHVATYRPSNIYDHHDLQAMRKNLNRDYILKNDITFTPMTDDTGTVVSNYEAAGDEDSPFTGGLDGGGYAIVGIQIESTSNYQGLFRVMEANTVDTKAAQNLVLRDFKITGNAYVGSLAGWIKKGTVDKVNVEVSVPDTGGYVTGTGDHVGGLVGSNDDMVTESSATGSVTGNDYIGGLVGSNSGDVTGYATGSVKKTTSDFAGTAGTGGLVGSNSGTVTGYATGSVISDGNAGGLVGYSSGTVFGYATGLVTGKNNAGGLVGRNDGTMTGYATGSVMGVNTVGGLVGWNHRNGTSIGYARSVVQRRNEMNSSFGKTIGFVSAGGSEKTYSSESESQVYDEANGMIALTDRAGVDGDSVTVDVSTTQMAFADFTFGTDIGKWTWVEDGKWPAINIGDEIKSAAEQPVDP